MSSTIAETVAATPSPRPVRGPLSPWMNARTAALLCAVLAVAFHLNALRNGFAYDDVHFLPEHKELHDWHNLPGRMLQPYWPGDWGKQLGLCRPATTLAFGVQWAIW